MIRAGSGFGRRFIPVQITVTSVDRVEKNIPLIIRSPVTKGIRHRRKPVGMYVLFVEMPSSGYAAHSFWYGVFDRSVRIKKWFVCSGESPACSGDSERMVNGELFLCGRIEFDRTFVRRMMHSRLARCPGSKLLHYSDRHFPFNPDL